MQFPNHNDTIVAIASGWRASPIGIVRLSGPDAIPLVERFSSPIASQGSAERHRTQQSRIQNPKSKISPARDEPSLGVAPGFESILLSLDDSFALPATAFYFRAPRSYTGQDVVELHTVGSLPALRELTARLVAAGARRALPGEFTARAFINGKLDASQVDGVFSLIHAGSADAARQATRLAGGRSRRTLDLVSERLLDLIARIEAGIDFVDEEDVQFISAAEARTEIDSLLTQLTVAAPNRFDQRRGKPHVALAGLPNAGKSSLFNALVGSQRAIVSPILGTTRDVLAAEVEMGGVQVVLQDCAGFGATSDDLELAAHVAAEAACDHADLVLWVHDASAVWTENERRACERIPFDRRILVLSKVDVRGTQLPAPTDFSATIPASAVNKSGLTDVRECVATVFTRASGAEAGVAATANGSDAAGALDRARNALGSDHDMILRPELVSLELRAAAATIGDGDAAVTVDRVFGRIFAQFCVGK